MIKELFGLLWDIVTNKQEPCRRHYFGFSEGPCTDCGYSMQWVPKK